MNATIPLAELPADVAEARHQFDEWRRTRIGRGVISADLWGVAVKVAAKYGVHPASRMLQVDYKCLKRQVEDTAMLAGLSQSQDAPVAFVEVRPGSDGSAAELALDLQRLLCGVAKEES